MSRARDPECRNQSGLAFRICGVSAGLVNNARGPPPSPPPQVLLRLWDRGHDEVSPAPFLSWIIPGSAHGSHPHLCQLFPGFSGGGVGGWVLRKEEWGGGMIYHA